MYDKDIILCQLVYQSSASQVNPAYSKTVTIKYYKFFKGISDKCLSSLIKCKVRPIHRTKTVLRRDITLNQTRHLVSSSIYTGSG